jgi:hypothetical protein
MKMLLRIVSYVSLVIVLVAMTIWIANEIRFRLAMPVDAESFNYSGSWKSQKVPMVAGRIVAELPSPPPKGKRFTVKAFVYYNITSLYRKGSFVPMEMEAFIDDTGTTSGGNSDNPVVLPPRVTFKFKGGDGGGQTIDYVSIFDDQFTLITGGYRSSSPFDMGAFSIEKSR